MSVAEKTQFKTKIVVLLSLHINKLSISYFTSTIFQENYKTSKFGDCKPTIPHILRTGPIQFTK